MPNAPTLAGLPDCLALLVPSAAQPFEDVFAHAMWLKTWFQDRAAIALELLHRAGDDDAASTRVVRVAELTGAAHRRRRRRADARALAQAAAGHAHRDAPRQAGRRMRPRARAQRRAAPALARPPGRALPARVAASNTLVLAGRCSFSLDELRYEYPQEIVPAGETPASLAAQAHRRRASPQALSRTACRDESTGSRSRASSRSSPQLEYEAYFLTVADIVRWAREQKHPLPGPRQRRQLARLLLPRRHRGRPATARRCCSAASSASSATSRPTSTSTSSTSAARR